MAKVVLVALLLCACGQRPDARPPEPPEPVVITVVGTNDLHGHIERLPLLAGYVTVLRQLRSKDGGAVVLVDGGDMFQGTLESNSNEGAAVIEIYNALGYTAAAIGNHEFDFGPVGDRATPEGPGDDPRGAIKARAAEADFPLLAANLVRADGGLRVQWPNAPASVVVEAAGVRVGIVGVTTADTPRTTIATNFAGLEVTPLADTIEAEAARLRGHGADVVVVAAHAGGRCHDFGDPRDLSSCAADQEIFQVVGELEHGAADVVVAGHTHAGVAHLVDGVPVIESFSRGAAFGRVDLTVVPGGEVQDVRIHPPRFLCREKPPPCAPGSYEGSEVAPDRRVAGIVERYVEEARVLREQPLGVTVESKVWRSYAEESALGNLLADLMREARPKADVAITNGGGLRADLPEGELTYGELYRAFPFDNRFASIRLEGSDLRRLIADNLAGESGIFSVSGVRVRARCRDGELSVRLLREEGSRISDGEELVLVTSDFLAHGGDGALGKLGLPDDAIELDDGRPIREEVAALLRKRRGTLSGKDPQLFDPKRRRLSYPGERPVTCR